jgi:tetratricopeptide (TPR) repeat protein
MKIHSPGTRLGQFEVVSYPVFNDVTIDYVCLDHERSSPALLKGLRLEFLSSRTACDCFAQCGAAWANLGDHAHLVRCHSVSQPENIDEIYLVLQVVVPEKERDTPSLLSWLIPGRPLPVLQALLFALQIARGMRHVADKTPGYVHGDLKPEHILVGGGRLSQANVNRLRVTDFGLSAVLQSGDIDLSKRAETGAVTVKRTQLINGVVGTPLYMAPEQWQGTSAGTATDVYAFGCLLYRMLVGRHILGGETTSELQNAHCKGNIRPLPATLPDSVCDLTIRCLALDSQKRFQSWQELEAAVAAAYQGTIRQPVPAPEPDDTLTESERALEGWFLNSMGSASNEAGSMTTAVKCLELALKAGQARNDQGLVGVATSNLGEAYRRMGDTQRAIDYHKKALTIAGEIGDKIVEGSALNNLGTVYLELGNPRQAIEYLEKSLAVARKLGHKQGEMAALVNIGSVYHQLGDLRRAIQYCEQELSTAREVGYRRGESIALTNLGGIYSDLGDYQRAIQYQQQALAIKSESGDRHAQISSFNNLANAYRDSGDTRQARDNYNKALEIALELSDRRGEAFALNNIGSTYANLGAMEPALKYHEQALEIFREIGDRRSQGDCLTNMGFIYMNRHDIRQAMECCEQALAIDREVGDMRGLALDSYNMANLLAQQNRFREALPYAEESAQILEKVGNTAKAVEARELVNRLGAEIGLAPAKPAAAATTVPANLRQQILQARRDNPKLTAKMTDEDILELFQQADQAIANDRPTVFVVQQAKTASPANPTVGHSEFDNRSMDELIVVGQQLVYDGNWQKAELAYQTLLKKAKQANHIPYQALALLLQGRLYTGQGNQSHALQLFRQALGLAQHVDDLKLVCQIHDGMGSALTCLGNYQEAIEHHRFAIEIYRRLGDTAGIIMSQANLGNVYSAQGNIEQAAQSFQELLAYTIRIGAEQATAQAYCNLGMVYYRQGRHELALEMESKSLEIALRLKDQLTAANAYGNLGTLYAARGDYETAVQRIRQALAIQERLGVEPVIAQKYADLASLYTKMGEFTQAFLSYDRALIYYERRGDTASLAKIHFNMGTLYRQQGKTAQAREQFQQAQSLFKSIGELDDAERAARQWRGE